MVELLDRVILRRPAETVLGRLRSSLHCAWIEVTRSQLSSSIGQLSSSMGLKPRLKTKKASFHQSARRGILIMELLHDV